MNREDVIRMAREAGFAVGLGSPMHHKLERFAALVAAAEREACAKVCEQLYKDVCADAIRARGQA